MRSSVTCCIKRCLYNQNNNDANTSHPRETEIHCPGTSITQLRSVRRTHYVSRFSQNNSVANTFAQYEKLLYEHYESDDIVIKSPSKIQDSPLKNRRSISPLKRHDVPSSSATGSFLSSKTPPTFVGIPHAFPLAPLHIDDDCNIPKKEKERGISCKFTVEFSARRFYSISWMVGICILMFLSLRFSVLNLPNQPDVGSETKKELQHLAYHQDNKAINTQARYDATTIIANAWDETVDGIVAESSASDSLTTKHDGSAIGAESDFAKSSKIMDGANVDINKDGSNDRFVTQQFQPPYSAYKKNAAHAPRFAYAYVISGCNEEAPHRNYLYDISISTYLQREAGSTADVIVYVQMAYESKLDELVEQDRNLLEAMNIYVKYIPKTAEESFYRTMLDKFLILGLVQYERVLFMDGDVLARGNLDYLFDLSVRGILKRNIVTAGKTEPANGGFFMLAPTNNATDRMMAIIRDKEARGKKLPYPHWDENVGWGHEFEEGDFARFKNGRRVDKWNFYGAFADQGMTSIAASIS